MTELSGRGVAWTWWLTPFAPWMARSAWKPPGAGLQHPPAGSGQRSIVRALIVDIAGEAYALPVNRIERVLRLDPAAVHSLEGKAFFLLGEDRLGWSPPISCWSWTARHPAAISPCW